jgi:hypothetical protein
MQSHHSEQADQSETARPNQFSRFVFNKIFLGLENHRISGKHLAGLEYVLKPAAAIAIGIAERSAVIADRNHLSLRERSFTNLARIFIAFIHRKIPVFHFGLAILKMRAKRILRKLWKNCKYYDLLKSEN